MRLSFCLMIVLFGVGMSDTILVMVQPDLDGLQLIREGSFHQVVLPGYPFLGLEGEPDLPHIPLKIALPAGCRAEHVTVRNIIYDTLPGTYTVAPVIPVICSIGSETASARPDEHIYASNSFYPGNLLELWQSGVLWGMPLASIWIRPVQWNPATGQLRVLRMAEVVVEYGMDYSQPTIHKRTQWSEDRARDILYSMAVNPVDIGYSGAVIVEPRQLEYGQYVVITTPEYLFPMQELADWKTAKGIPAGVFTTDWVQSNYPCIDLQQSVRAFLTDCREEGVDFVLLAGDNDVFEARFTYPVRTPGYVPLPSDLYYADNNDTEPGFDMWDSNGNGYWGEWEDNVEWHPDLWVGRASVNSLEEAMLFVDKVLIYEHVQEVPLLDYFGGWPDEMRFGYTTGFLQPGTNPGSWYAESISTFVPNSWSEEKCYESWGNNSTDITIAMINNGPHQIFHANHGSFDCMYTAYGDLFTVDDIMELQNITNSGNVAIWNSIACSIGGFDTLTCCADAWLNSPEGGGFACMNARPVFALSSFPICEQFYIAFLVNGFCELGIAHGLSLDYLCPPTSGSVGSTVQGNNLFGDPELPMWTAPSVSLDMNHPSSIEGSCMISVYVSSSGGMPVEGARVCLQKGSWQTGEVYEVGYTDVGGHLSLWVNPQTPGEISLTVWAHNFDPYFGSIDVISEEQEEEVVYDYSLIRITPNPSSAPVQMHFSLPENAYVELNIFDISGRLIFTPASGPYDSGIHETTVGGLQSGVYFVRMESGSFSAIQRFVVIE